MIDRDNIFKNCTESRQTTFLQTLNFQKYWTSSDESDSVKACLKRQIC